MRASRLTPVLRIARGWVHRDGNLVIGGGFAVLRSSVIAVTVQKHRARNVQKEAVTSDAKEAAS